MEIYLTRDVPVKNSLCEIANRLLQDRLYKNMDARRSNNWIDHLGDVLVGINNMKRKILFGYSSKEVKDNEDIMSIVQKKNLEKLHDYNDQFKSHKKKFKVGDTVKTLRKHSIFQKGYLKKTDDEIDIVKKILHTWPPTYLLEGKRRPYYESELIKIRSPSQTENYRYYIDGEKSLTRRELRSGQSRPSSERVYTLKSRENPDFEETIDEGERRNLIRDGRLPPFSPLE